MTHDDETEAERVAICIEAGVPEARARQIAACEREMVERSWSLCRCGSHHEQEDTQ